MRLVSLFLLSLLALVASPKLRPDVMVRPEAASLSAAFSSWTSLFSGSPVFGNTAWAMPKGVSWPGPFRVQVVAVKDGDTVEILFREGPCAAGGLGAPCEGNILALRIRGIDTPEKKLCQKRSRQSCAACPEEAALGQRATRLAEELLVGKLAARVTNLGRDPYFGRIVGTLEILHEGRFQSYADLVIAAGLANAYDPSASGNYTKTKGWCPQKAG
jgi:endonuclease YncB( thermonuclease family)